MMTNIRRQQANNDIGLLAAATSTDGGCACCNSGGTLELVATFTAACLGPMQDGSDSAAEMTRGPTKGGSTRRRCQPCQCSDLRRIASLFCLTRYIFASEFTGGVLGHSHPLEEKATVRGILPLLQRHTLVQSFGQKNHVRLKAGSVVISPYTPNQKMQIPSSCTSMVSSTTTAMVWQHSTWGQWSI